MRTWRVGTFSMGAALISLGLFLLFSRWFEMDLFHVMASWWPIILIVLGIEILIYLFVNKGEKQLLKYDLLSIFFVGVLGTVGIGFAIISSVGLFDKIEQTLNQKEKTIDLPSFSQTINDDIKRVVVDTSRYPITIEGTNANEISMFGTYRSTFVEEQNVMEEASDYMSTEKVGDTLYISVKPLPSQSGPFDTYAEISATLLVPFNVILEVNAQGNSVTIKPRTLLSNWFVNNAFSVNVQVVEKADIVVSAIGAQELTGNSADWTISEEKTNEEEYITNVKNGKYQQGKGTHSLKITNTTSVSLNTLK